MTREHVVALCAGGFLYYLDIKRAGPLARQVVPGDLVRVYHNSSMTRETFAMEMAPGSDNAGDDSREGSGG